MGLYPQASTNLPTVNTGSDLHELSILEQRPPLKYGML